MSYPLFWIRADPRATSGRDDHPGHGVAVSAESCVASRISARLIVVSGLIWLDGRVLEARDAKVAAVDHGVSVGDGAFETLKIIGDTPFAFTRHMARLRRSLAVLGLAVPMADAEFRDAATELVSALAATRAVPGRLRITVTAGPGPLGSGRTATPPTVIIAAAPAVPLPPTERVVRVPWVRNERSAVAGAKTTSYAENVVALAHAKAHGAGEAIFANTVGALCEGTGTNVFLGRGGRLFSPARGHRLPGRGHPRARVRTGRGRRVRFAHVRRP